MPGLTAHGRLSVGLYIYTTGPAYMLLVLDITIEQPGLRSVLHTPRKSRMNVEHRLGHQTTDESGDGIEPG